MSISRRKRIARRGDLKAALGGRFKPTKSHWDMTFISSWEMAIKALREGWRTSAKFRRRLVSESARILNDQTARPQLKLAVGKYLMALEKKAGK